MVSSQYSTVLPIRGYTVVIVDDPVDPLSFAHDSFANWITLILVPFSDTEDVRFLSISPKWVACIALGAAHRFGERVGSVRDVSGDQSYDGVQIVSAERHDPHPSVPAYS
jgi:hypothetical protein